MKTTRWWAVMTVAGLTLFAAAPRSEAGKFSFSIFFNNSYCPPPGARPHKVWVPGHYEVRQQKVWVPGYAERVWIPPTYKPVWNGCRHVRVICAPGHY